MALMAGITIDEFWQMTVDELSLCLEAYARNEDKKLKLEAWKLAHILNCYSKKKLPQRCYLAKEPGT